MLSHVIGKKGCHAGNCTNFWNEYWNMPLPTNTAPFNGPASNMVLCEDPFSGGQAFLLFQQCCEDPRDATHTVIDSSKPSEKVATCLLSKRLSSFIKGIESR